MIEIVGYQKLTLLDFPGYTAATFFTNGCNFRCPYCHNSPLVIAPSNNEIIDESEILDFLKKRVGLLDGICITGGEPLLQKDLIPFIKKVKELGYKVKLDTNGYLFSKLKEIIDLKLVDYIAMDIKNSLEKYHTTVGLNEIAIKNITSSIEYIKNSDIDYEFRTTVVKELHSHEDIRKIGELLKGSKRYFLQQFKKNEFNIVKEGYSSWNKEILEEFKRIIIDEYSIPCELRGID